MADNRLIISLGAISETKAMAKVNYLPMNLSVDITLTDVPVELILKKLEWYYEHSSENTVHIRSIETQIMNEGGTLFNQVFGTDLTGKIWKAAKSSLSSLIIEVVDNDTTSYQFPWEIMYEPAGREFLIRKIAAFTRVNRIGSPKIETISEKIRVLLVIARPMTYADIPISTIANAIIGAFDGNDRFQFTVLRPPTFENLANVLEAATSKGAPFHIVHFDGHGIHGSQGVVGLSPAKGYLVFENANFRTHVFIDGSRIGKLLSSCGVRVFVMNACRSGYVNYTQPTNPGYSPPPSSSLAHDILAEGVDIAIAMKYEVSPSTARMFMKSFYKSIEEGLSVVEAFNGSRKQLVYKNDDDSRNLDLFVPVLIKQKDILFNKQSKFLGLNFRKLLSKKAPESKPAINVFDDLIIQFEKLAYQQQTIHVYGAFGSGKTSFFNSLALWSANTNFADLTQIIPINEDSSVDDILSSLPAVASQKRILILIDDLEKCGGGFTQVLERLDAIRKTAVATEFIFAVSTRGKRDFRELDGLAKMHIYIRDKEYFKRFVHILWAKHYPKDINVSPFLVDFAVNAIKGNLQSISLTDVAFGSAVMTSPNFKNVLFHRFFRFTALDTMIKMVGEKKLESVIAGAPILHLVHKGFPLAFPETVMKAAGNGETMGTVVGDSLRQMEDAGLLIEIVDDHIYQLHPFAVHHVTMVFESAFPMERQQALVLTTINRLIDEIRLAKDFTGQILLANIPVAGIYILQRKMGIPQQPFLAFYILQGGDKDVSWNLWIENGFEQVTASIRENKDYPADDSLISEILAFAFHYVQLCTSRLKYTEACNGLRSLGDLTALTVRIGKMSAEQREICVRLLTDIIRQFADFETLLLKIESKHVSDLAAPLNEASNGVFALCKEWGHSDCCAELNLYQASRLLSGFTEFTHWYFQMMRKLLIFKRRSDQHPDESVRYYFSGIKYFQAQYTQKSMEFFEMSMDSFIARPESVGTQLDEQDLGQLVFGKNYLEKIDELQKLLQEAELFAGSDTVVVREIVRIRRELKQAVRSKLRFYLFSIFDVMLLIDINISINIGNIDQMLLELKKAHHDEKEDGQIESSIAAIFDHAGLGAVDEVFDGLYTFAALFSDQKNYHHAIRVLEEATPKAGRFDIEQILLQIEILAVLYHTCDSSDSINFYTTPVFTYLTSKLAILLNDSIDGILAEDKNFIAAMEMATLLQERPAEADSIAQMDRVYDVLKEITSLDDMIEQEKKVQEKSEILLKDYFRDQGKLGRQQIFSALKDTDQLIAILSSSRRMNTSLMRREIDLHNLQAAIVIDYFKDLSRGDMNTFADQLYVLKRCQEAIVSLRPYTTILEETTDTIATLKELYRLMTPMMWEIVTYFVYTEGQKRDLNANERKIVIAFADIAVNYFDEFYKEAAIDTLEKIRLNGKVTSILFLTDWKLEYLVKELVFYTLENSDHAAPWALMATIEETAKEVGTRGGALPELMSAVIFEQTLHWSLKSLPDVIEQRMKSGWKDGSDIEKQLVFCYSHIYNEFGSTESHLNDQVPMNMRSALARNASRSELYSMMSGWKESIQKVAEESRLRQEEKINVVETNIINN